MRDTIIITVAVRITAWLLEGLSQGTMRAYFNSGHAAHVAAAQRYGADSAHLSRSQVVVRVASGLKACRHRYAQPPELPSRA